ncbi:MAG: tetratricopeptide repeat protein [Thermomicrobiales bacterium]
MTTPATTSFAALLRQHRLAAGLTQEELAERAGLSTRGLQDLERGIRQSPRLESIRLLADALDLPAAARTALIAAARPAAPGIGEVPATRSLVPIPPTVLIGREAEVAVVCDLLQRPGVRLLTLTGPGGVGKTRLALAIAAELAPRFDSGAVWVDFAPLRDPGLVPGAIARVLGVREPAAQSPETVLTAALAARDLLLVLDNCEHVLAAMPLVSVLLGGCSGLTVLATSRARLRLRGERELAVGPLAVPTDSANAAPPLAGLAGVPAIRLFVERAQEVAPGFALTAETAAPVAAICRQLEGLPLALELAAARVKILAPEALLARLEQRLPVLTGGARDLPRRQQTMRQAIAWSYDLLTPDEQSLFRRLAVFAGGCTLAAVEDIADSADGPGGGALPARLPASPGRSDDPVPSSVFDRLTALIDQSLLRAGIGAGGEPRFVMLAVIREFGRERLESSGEATAIGARHAAYFLALAERAERELTAPTQAAWLDRLDREIDNLRAALGTSVERDDAETAFRLAAALSPFWRIRGHVRDGRAWLEQVLALPSATAVRSSHRARVLAGLGTLLTILGEYEAAQARLEESLAQQRGGHDRRAQAAILQNLGLVAQHQKAYDRSVGLYEQSLTLARESGDDQAIVVALNGLALAAQARGALAQATRLYEESLAVARRVGAPRSLAITIGNLGNLAADQGNADRAAALYQESLTLYREIGDQRGTAICLYSLGHQAVVHDEARAHAFLAEALQVFVDLGDASAVAETLDVLARVHAEHGSTMTAARLLAAAASLRARTGIPAPIDAHYRADVDRAVALVDAGLTRDQIDRVRIDVNHESLAHVVAAAMTAPQPREFGAPAIHTAKEARPAGH